MLFQLIHKVWYLIIFKNTKQSDAVIVNPPYVDVIIFIAFDKQKIQATITKNSLKFVNPFSYFKKPLEVIPKIIANNKKIYPDNLS